MDIREGREEPYFVRAAGAAWRALRGGITTAAAGAVLLLAAPAEAKQRGLASYYGPGFHGRTMANGKRFNQNAAVIAHRRLPLGSTVRVCRVDKRRCAVAEVTDRGPYVPPRIADLSQGMARRLGTVKQGVAMVEIQVLRRGKGT
jgi:rare lipoprotein A (peptidoglycan hydrolase)